MALFNAFGKISTSIVELQRFRDMLKAQEGGSRAQEGGFQGPGGGL